VLVLLVQFGKNRWPPGGKLSLVCEKLEVVKTRAVKVCAKQVLKEM
jgi:hypothetical protein